MKATDKLFFAPR